MTVAGEVKSEEHLLTEPRWHFRFFFATSPHLTFFVVDFICLFCFDDLLFFFWVVLPVQEGLFSPGTYCVFFWPRVSCFFCVGVFWSMLLFCSWCFVFCCALVVHQSDFCGVLIMFLLMFVIIVFRLLMYGLIFGLFVLLWFLVLLWFHDWVSGNLVDFGSRVASAVFFVLSVFEFWLHVCVLGWLIWVCM